MSAPEYDLFELLVKQRGKIVSRDQIFIHLKGIEYDGRSRQVDLYVSNLRAKLDDGIPETCLIKTIRSKGYMLLGG